MATAPGTAGQPLPGSLGDVARYYSARVRRYGATPLGVDWTCVPTQQLRFVQLLKVVRGPAPFSIHDLGCGYGALLDFMRTKWRASDFEYVGTDVSAAMIHAARQQHLRKHHVRFDTAQAVMPQADYTVASGVFNVKLESSRSAWEALVKRSLKAMAAASRLGLAVNFIESSPGVSMPPQLYRTRAERWSRFCEDELGFSTQVVRGYGLREFTLCALRR